MLCCSALLLLLGFWGRARGAAPGSALQSWPLRNALLLGAALTCGVLGVLGLLCWPPATASPRAVRAGAGAFLLLAAALDHDLFRLYRLGAQATQDLLLIVPGLLLLASAWPRPAAANRGLGAAV